MRLQILYLDVALSATTSPTPFPPLPSRTLPHIVANEASSPETQAPHLCVRIPAPPRHVAIPAQSAIMTKSAGETKRNVNQEDFALWTESARRDWLPVVGVGRGPRCGSWKWA